MPIAPGKPLKPQVYTFSNCSLIRVRVYSNTTHKYRTQIRLKPVFFPGQTSISFQHNLHVIINPAVDLLRAEAISPQIKLQNAGAFRAPEVRFGHMLYDSGSCRH